MTFQQGGGYGGAQPEVQIVGDDGGGWGPTGAGGAPSGLSVGPSGLFPPPTASGLSVPQSGGGYSSGFGPGSGFGTPSAAGNPAASRPGAPRGFAGAKIVRKAERVTSKGRTKACVLALAKQAVGVCEENAGVRRLVPMKAIKAVKVSTAPPRRGKAVQQVVLCLPDSADDPEVRGVEPDLVFNLVDEGPPLGSAQNFIDALVMLRRLAHDEETAVQAVPHPAAKHANHRKDRRKERANPDVMLNAMVAAQRKRAETAAAAAARPDPLPLPEPTPDPVPAPMPPPPVPGPEPEPAPPPRELSMPPQPEPDVPPGGDGPFRLRHRESGWAAAADGDGKIVIREGEGDLFAFSGSGLRHVESGAWVVPTEEEDESGEPVAVLALTEENDGGAVWGIEGDMLMEASGDPPWCVAPLVLGDDESEPPLLRLVEVPDEAADDEEVAGLLWDRVPVQRQRKAPRKKQSPAPAPPPEPVDEGGDEEAEEEVAVAAVEAGNREAGSEPQELRRGSKLSELTPGDAWQPATPPEGALLHDDYGKRARRWLEEGFTVFYAKHDPVMLKVSGATEAAARAALRDCDAAYRDLLARHPTCPVEDLDWLRHLPPRASPPLRSRPGGQPEDRASTIVTAESLHPLHTDVAALQKQLQQMWVLVSASAWRQKELLGSVPGRSPRRRQMSPDPAPWRPHPPPPPHPRPAVLLSPSPDPEPTVAAPRSHVSPPASPPRSAYLPPPSPPSHLVPSLQPLPQPSPQPSFRSHDDVFDSRRHPSDDGEQVRLLRRLVHFQQLEHLERERRREGAEGIVNSGLDTPQSKSEEVRILQAQVRLLRELLQRVPGEQQSTQPASALVPHKDAAPVPFMSPAGAASSWSRRGRVRLSDL